MAIEFPEPKMVKTKEITIEVFEQGEGFPVVLAHGFPELAYSWRFQIPVLAEAGYRVIAPNQRGYGATDKPEPVEAYDLQHLCGDMAGLLDALGLDKAIFVGHDWGGPVVWNMPLYHPDRVAGVVGMSVPFQPRGKTDPVAFMEQIFGPDMYIVQFNRQPGVADRIFADNIERFFTNVFRHKQWEGMDTKPRNDGSSFGVSIINSLKNENPPGEPLMSDKEMAVFIEAFRKGGFTGPINWYRNITRNWEISADLPQKINVPCGMIYGTYDLVPKGGDVSEYVPDLEIIEFECGHWIQQEKVNETNTFLLDWLKRNAPSAK
jgi:pimeloyl-ACP methyl ester carboxylesterase